MPLTLNRLELEAIFSEFSYLYDTYHLQKFQKKIHEVRSTCPGWFNMQLANEAFFPLSNRYNDHCKNVF